MWLSLRLYAASQIIWAASQQSSTYVNSSQVRIRFYSLLLPSIHQTRYGSDLQAYKPLSWLPVVCSSAIIQTRPLFLTIPRPWNPLYTSSSCNNSVFAACEGGYHLWILRIVSRHFLTLCTSFLPHTITKQIICSFRERVHTDIAWLLKILSVGNENSMARNKSPLERLYTTSHRLYAKATSLSAMPV